MTSTPDLGALMEEFLGCADEALSGPTLGRVQLSPGSQVAYDDCCDGQLWVRVTSIAPSGEPYPYQANRQACGVVLWAASLAVGVVRCAAVVDDNGVAPEPGELTYETRQMLADMAELEQAIRCCMSELVTKLTLGAWTPIGPEGGCVGGEWAFTVSLDVCSCEPNGTS